MTFRPNGDGAAPQIGGENKGPSASGLAVIALIALGIACIGAFAVRIGTARLVELCAYSAGAFVSIAGLLWFAVGAAANKMRGDHSVSTSDALPPIHTLVSVSPEPGAQDDDELLQVEIDPIFYDRIDEYKAYRPSEGCVVLVTETTPPFTDNARAVGGAVAMMCLARKIAEGRATPILLIDTGSTQWNRGGGSGEPMALPDMPGVYEILSGTERFVNCILAEDELPGLTAIAPGIVPANWAEQVVSADMRTLILSARTTADLIFIYAPRCWEHPEIIRQLSEWSNCVMLVTASGPDAVRQERAAISGLHNSGAVLFGRIALQAASQRHPVEQKR